MKQRLLPALLSAALVVGVLAPALPASASERGRYDHDYSQYHRRYDRDYSHKRDYRDTFRHGFIDFRDGRLLFCKELDSRHHGNNDVLICVELDR